MKCIKVENSKEFMDNYAYYLDNDLLNTNNYICIHTTLEFMSLNIMSI